LDTAPEAEAEAQIDLDAAIVKRDGFQVDINEATATIVFMTATPINTATTQG
jgi:hypothetical protein